MVPFARIDQVLLAFRHHLRDRNTSQNISHNTQPHQNANQDQGTCMLLLLPLVFLLQDACAPQTRLADSSALSRSPSCCRPSPERRCASGEDCLELGYGADTVAYLMQIELEIEAEDTVRYRPAPSPRTHALHRVTNMQGRGALHVQLCLVLPSSYLNVFTGATRADARALRPSPTSPSHLATSHYRPRRSSRLSKRRKESHQRNRGSSSEARQCMLPLPPPPPRRSLAFASSR